MTAASPWSVKGIDPKAREMAKDLARRSGLTLGEWLNQMIIEGEAEAPPFEAGYRSPASREISRDFSPPGEAFRSPVHKPAELQRINQALEQLSVRIEAAEHRSTLAISGIDQSVMGVLSRLESAERDQSAVAARFDGALEDVRQTQAKTAEQVRRMAEEDLPRVEAIKALEGAIGKLGEKLYDDDSRHRGALNELREDFSNLSRRIDRTDAKVEGAPGPEHIDAVVAKLTAQLEEAESRSSAAVRALETSFAGLDARLSRSGAEMDQDGGARFERLAADLTAKVEASRAEMADRLRDLTSSKIERMEAAVRDLTGHVEQGERRSAQAMDRMGREVMRIASSVGDRVAKVEARSAQAVEQVGGEMARIAEAVEQRLGRQDTVQAQALERLGGEISRIAEKLAERIGNAERRSAQSLDDVSDQLGRVTERLNQRYDRAQSELGDRIQQSEERTIKLLDETRDKIEARLAEAQRRASLEMAAEAARKAVEAEATPGDGPSKPHGVELRTPFDSTVALQSFGAGETFGNSPFAAESSSFPAEPQFSPIPPAAPDAPALDLPVDEPFLAAPAPSTPSAFAFEAEPAPDYQAPTQAPPSSTREMLDQARAAVRQASEGRDARPRGRNDAAPAGAVEAPPFEADAAKGFSFSLPRRKKKDGVTIRTALVASGTAAALAVTGAGAILWANAEGGGSAVAEHQSDHFGVAPTAVAQNDSTPPAITAAPTAAPPLAPAPPSAVQAAVAFTPPAGQTEGLTAPPQKLAETPHPVASGVLYSSAVRKIAGGDPSGVEDLKKAANLGNASAQFYLGKLYETGGSGVPKDLSEARRWTERAANGGDVAAMHNLGLYYYEGEAGPQDSVKAAEWFRRAADQGVKDSQYNLAMLYAKGTGVAQNQAEAYKWYLIAAAGGDDGARTAAQSIRAQLTPEAQTAAERAAAAFHAQSQGAMRSASAAPPQ